PILLMTRVAHGVDRVAAQEFFLHVEAQHVTGKTRGLVFCVPIARNLSGVLLGHDDIENRLGGETRGKGAKSRGLDEMELGLSNRAIESFPCDWHSNAILLGPQSCGPTAYATTAPSPFSLSAWKCVTSASMTCWRLPSSTCGNW